MNVYSHFIKERAGGQAAGRGRVGRGGWLSEGGGGREWEDQVASGDGEKRERVNYNRDEKEAGDGPRCF